MAVAKRELRESYMFARTMWFALVMVCWVGFAQAAGETIRDVQVKALDGFSADDGDVRAVIRAKIGDTVLQVNLSKDVEALLATKRFSKAEVEVQPIADGCRIIYTVVRRPVVFGDIELTGVDYFSNSKVEDWLELVQGAPVDDQILAERCNKVRSEYLKRYFPKTEVTASMHPVVDSRDRKGLVRVNVQVMEGPRLKPDEYSFDGNEHIASKDLRATFGEYPWWNPRGWFTTAPYSEDQLAKARQQAAEAYLNQGYLDVKISDARFVPLPDNPKRADVRFTVDEGGRYTVENMLVTGVKIFPEPAVRATITMLKPGDIASRKEIDKAAKAVRDYYTSRGYIDTSVNVSIKTKNVAAPTQATIVFDVQEGILVKVRTITIRGNTRTQDKVARREIQLNPNDVMDGVKIEQNENRIKNLGVFNKDTVRHSIPPNPETPDSRDLIFDVEETRTGSFMIGGGFSSVDKLVGYIQLQQANFDILNYPNFTGGGQKARASMEIGSNHQSYELGWTEPWFMDKPMALTVDLYYREREYDEYRQTNLGGDVGIKYPIKLAGIPFGAFGVRYTMEQITLRDQLTNQFQLARAPYTDYKFTDEPDSSFHSELQASWEYDTRDQIFVPKRGTDATVFSGVSGAPLGGDASDDLYHMGASAKHWFNPWWSHVLSLKGRMETISSYGDQSYDGQSVPIYERLFLGGGQTLRGVAYRDVGPKVVNKPGDPYAEHPIGGATLGLVSAEYSVPIFEAVRIATFSDAGNVTPDSYDFANVWKNYCWTYGAGLRIDIPGFPIRFDYAVPIKKDSELTRDNHFIFWIGFE